MIPSLNVLNLGEGYAINCWEIEQPILTNKDNPPDLTNTLLIQSTLSEKQKHWLRLSQTAVKTDCQQYLWCITLR